MLQPERTSKLSKHQEANCDTWHVIRQFGHYLVDGVSTPYTYGYLLKVDICHSFLSFQFTSRVFLVPYLHRYAINTQLIEPFYRLGPTFVGFRILLIH